LQNIEIGV